MMTPPESYAAQKLAYWKARREDELRQPDLDPYMLNISEAAIDLYSYLSGKGE